MITLFFSSNSVLGQEEQISNQWDVEFDRALQLWSQGQKDSSLIILLGLEDKSNYLPDEFCAKLFVGIAIKLEEIGELHSALEYKKKSVQIHPIRDSIPYIEAERIAQFHNNLNQRDSAIYYTKLAHTRFSKGLTRFDSAQAILMNNNIGYYYYLEGELDSAIVYYTKVVTTYTKIHFPAKYGIAIGNMAQVYFDQGDYQTALELAREELKLSKIYVPESYMVTLLLAANCCYQLNLLDEAEGYIDTFLKNKDSKKHTDKSKSRIVNPKLIKKAYELKAKILYQRNEPKAAYKTFILLNQFSDSLSALKQKDEQYYSSFTNYRLQSIQQKLELNRKERAIAEANAAKKTVQIRIYVAILILALLLTIVGIYLYRLFLRRKEKFKQMNYDLLQLELENKRKDVTQFGMELSNKREFFNEMNEHLSQILKKPVKESHQKIRTLLHAINHRASMEENLVALRTDIEKVNNSFFETLGAKYPKLTRTEKEICGLLILNFSTKNIALIRNVTTNAVKKKRQIIRKKLPISSEEDLVEFLIKNSKPNT